MITSPYFWLVLLLTLFVFFAGGYQQGAKNTRNQMAAEQLQAVAQARIEAIEQAKADQITAQNYEEKRETVRIIYLKAKEKARENIENNPEYGNCSLDTDGLWLYNSHPGRTSPGATGTDGAVSGSAGGGGWQDLNDPFEQPGAGADVLRLPGAPQSIIGMGGIGGTGAPANQIAQANGAV